MHSLDNDIFIIWPISRKNKNTTLTKKSKNFYSLSEETDMGIVLLVLSAFCLS